MKSKAGRGFLKAIIIVGFLFAIVYFISYNKWLNHNFDSIDIRYKEENARLDDDQDELKTDYKELYNSINYEFLENNFGEEFFDIYYNGGKISNEYLIYLGVINIIKEDIKSNCNFKIEINSTDLYNKIKTLVGNVNYEDKSFTTKNKHLNIEYNDSNKSYVVSVNKCSGFDFSNGGIKSTYKETKTENGYVYIYDNSIYLDYSEKNGFSYHADIQKDSKVVSNSFENIDFNSIPIYEYKFRIGNGSNTLMSITRK